MPRNNGTKKTKSPYMEISSNNDQKEAYKSNSFQFLKYSLTFIVRNSSPFSATSLLSLSTIS